ncbi:MAG TPA: hypothetical protein VD790_04380 [Thermoleophilaceae bacterium]|nr:hypothetical protein [Thermoleophilaceae bacterium]
MRPTARVLALIGVVLAVTWTAGSALTASGDATRPAESAASPLFTERFENDLGRWVGKAGGAHSGVIVDDPIRPGNRVLTFNSLASGGDIFSRSIEVSKKKTYRLKFDYLGEPGEGVRGDLGGIIGLAIKTPGHHRWLAGTQKGAGESDPLKDDGDWHTYKINFVPGGKTWFTQDGASAVTLKKISKLRLMLEDNAGSQGVAGDAHFDNITLTECDTCGKPKQEDVRVHVRFHANNLATEPPKDGGQCPGDSARARITGEIVARIVDGDHQGSGNVVDTPHRSRCRVPVIGVRVDKVQMTVVKPGKIMRAKLSVHIDSEGVHRPGQCRVGTKGTITAVYDDTQGAKNGLRNHSLQIGPWKSPCGAHTHKINNNISSIPADASSSTWVRVSIACPGPGFAPRNCGD